MTYIPDLAPCDYLNLRRLPTVAIGWLGPPHPIPQGVVPAVSRAKLDEQIAGAFEFDRPRGGHRCEFCPDSRGHHGRSLRPVGIANCLPSLPI